MRIDLIDGKSEVLDDTQLASEIVNGAPERAVPRRDGKLFHGQGELTLVHGIQNRL